MATRTFYYGVDDCKIAAWNSTGSWATALDVQAINQFQVTVQTTSAQLEGDDQIVDTHSKVIGAQISLQFGFNDLAVWPVLSGATHETGGTPYLRFADDTRPFFGICAAVTGTAAGNKILFMPKAKIIDDLSLSVAYGQYNTPQVTAQAVLDSPYDILRLYDYTSTTAIAFPPTGS